MGAELAREEARRAHDKSRVIRRRGVKEEVERVRERERKTAEGSLSLPQLVTTRQDKHKQTQGLRVRE